MLAICCTFLPRQTTMMPQVIMDLCFLWTPHLPTILVQPAPQKPAWPFWEGYPFTNDAICCGIFALTTVTNYKPPRTHGNVWIGKFSHPSRTSPTMIPSHCQHILLKNNNWTNKRNTHGYNDPQTKAHAANTLRERECLIRRSICTKDAMAKRCCC